MKKKSIKELWKLACEYDNIPEGSKFVVFSEDNPYDKEYNKAVKENRETKMYYDLLNHRIVEVTT